MRILTPPHSPHQDVPTTTPTTPLPSTPKEHVSFRESLISQGQLTECDKLDLKFLGNIQGETANVMFMSYPECIVRAADANVLQVPFIQECITKKYQDREDSTPKTSLSHVLGKPAQDLFPPHIWEKLKATIEEMGRNACMREFIFLTASDGRYTLSVSTTTADHSLVSIEMEAVSDNEASESFNSTFVFLSRSLDLYANSEDAAKMGCDSIFKLLPQFERGMVYRFNDDLSGEIVHEVKSSHIESSYLGLTFPHSDIPQSSRLLYKKNILRYIADVDATNVPVLCHQDQPAVDLTQTRSRSVHSSHLLYLRNMGVKSSMSIAIVCQGELWGLLSFHGYKQAFKPTLHQRMACETIGSCISARVDSLTRKIQTSKLVRLGQLFKKWKPSAHCKNNLEAVGDQILDVLQADVLVGRFNMQESETRTKVVCLVKGDVAMIPGGGFWNKMSHLEPRTMHVKSTAESIGEMGLTKDDCPASGFCYFSGGSETGIQIMIGRAHRGRDVRWAGSPDAPKLKIDGILHPRASFEAQLEKSKKESVPFTPNDVLLMELLRDRILDEHSNSLMLSLLENDIGQANLLCFTALQRTEENNDFLAHMCHELRTPFHGVMGCLNILQEAIDDMSTAEIKEMINASIETGTHMIHLLNDILTTSKNQYISASKASDTVVYSTFAQTAVQGMKPLATNSNVHLTSHISCLNESVGLRSKIELDRTKMIQIITNLTNNAIKFAGPQGRVDVKFKLEANSASAVSSFVERASSYAGSAFMFKNCIINNMQNANQRIRGIVGRDDQRMWFCFSVTDSGVGMYPNELVKMFEPYTQSNNAGATTKVKGTGLGLFISVELCRRLNGFIACSSTPNEGTVFHVGIPVEQHESRIDISSEISFMDIGDDIVVNGPILLVDDNRLNIKIIERQLRIQFKQRGIDIEIIKAGGGYEAVSAYKKHFPSVLVVDYHMPDLDGLEATSLIRKIEAEQNLPPAYIISYTADATEKASQLLLGAGANEIMLKPPPRNVIPNLVDRFRVESRTKVFNEFT